MKTPIKQAAAEVAECMPNLITNPTGALNCYPVNVVAAVILRDHYGHNLRHVIGSFGLATSDRPQDTMTFGPEMGIQIIQGGGGGFAGHYWLQAGNTIFDFAWKNMPLICERDRDWQWTIPRRDVFVGNAYAKRRTVSLRTGQHTYKEWSQSDQADAMRRFIKSDLNEYISIGESLASNWGERLDTWIGEQKSA